MASGVGGRTRTSNAARAGGLQPLGHTDAQHPRIGNFNATRPREGSSHHYKSIAATGPATIATCGQIAATPLQSQWSAPPAHPRMRPNPRSRATLDARPPAPRAPRWPGARRMNSVARRPVACVPLFGPIVGPQKRRRPPGLSRGGLGMRHVMTSAGAAYALSSGLPSFRPRPKGEPFRWENCLLLLPSMPSMPSMTTLA